MSRESNTPIPPITLSAMPIASAAATPPLLFPRPRPRVADAAQQPTADERQHEDAEGEPDQLLVEPHVAVQDVAELVRDHALQLGAIEALERAARDAIAAFAGRAARPRTH